MASKNNSAGGGVEMISCEIHEQHNKYCRDCRNVYARDYYQRNRDKILIRESAQRRKYSEDTRKELKEKYKKYHRTKKGLLVSKYSNMKKRVSGTSSYYGDIRYVGLPLMDRDDFIKQSLADISFNKLFDMWEEAGHELKLTPSPDRIDSSKGYVWDNIQWVTMSENCRRGAKKKRGSRNV